MFAIKQMHLNYVFDAAFRDRHLTTISQQMFTVVRQ